MVCALCSHRRAKQPATSPHSRPRSAPALRLQLDLSHAILFWGGAAHLCKEPQTMRCPAVLHVRKAMNNNTYAEKGPNDPMAVVFKIPLGRAVILFCTLSSFGWPVLRASDVSSCNAHCSEQLQRICCVIHLSPTFLIKCRRVQADSGRVERRTPGACQQISPQV